MRARCRYLLASVAFGACSIFGLPVQAQEKGRFALEHFNPSERGSEWFVLDTLDFRGDRRLAAGVVGDWGYRPLVVYNADGSEQSVVVRHQATLHAGASLLLWERLRVAINMPLQVYASGSRGELGRGRVLLPPQDTTMAGDLRLSADARFWGSYGDPFTAAAGASVWLPTGDPKSYSGDPSMRVAPHVTVAGDVAPFVYSGSLGLVFRDTNGFGDHAVGSQLTLAAAAGVRLLDGKLIVGPELFGDTVLGGDDSALSKRATPFEALLGAHYTIADQVRVGAGIGTGLAQGYGSPKVRGILSVEWVPPPDRAEPPPPPVAEQPRDRDADGVIDGDDACPDEAGVRTEQSKTNGCPAAVDKDGDGVVDSADACVDVPGRVSDDPKQSGCPLTPADADSDGVVDAEDACPALAGPKSPDPKKNGCPDSDPDHDGIANDADACPNDAGNADPDPKKNGCPKAFVKEGQIKISDQVKFGNNSGVLLPDQGNQATLEAVLSVLQQHPEIAGISVEGYSDNVGSAESNKSLSKRRAAAVMAWLVKRGVDPKRLTSAGFGAEKPIDSNDTAAGRANNRRVEFRILEAAPGAAGGEAKP